MRIDLFLLGFVDFEVDAEDATALFEGLRAEGISPKRVRRYEKNGKIGFTCTLFSALRLSKKNPKLTEVNRGGLPVFFARLSHRPGLICGLALALSLLFVSRLFVWDVEVQGNETVETEEIISELAAAGLSCGSFLPRLDREAVAIELRRGDGRIAFATVNLRGTVAYVQVRETAEAPQAAVPPPANLVAKCDGVITLPLIFEGECLVSEGDVVRAGQILAGGVIDSEKHGYRITRAAGQVLARTVHTYTVNVPFAYEEKVYTGRTGKEISLLFFTKRGKLFKNTRNIGNSYDIITNVNWWTLSDGRQLPIGFIVSDVAEYELRPAVRDGVQACELAYAELERQLSQDSVGRSMLERTVELVADADGITLICTVVCEEDIAETAEIKVTVNH
ncbi:MAG: sporulation protein YqfD [Clostridia bacterium]|nr:sporulation protein YqfD [Clostridia bacterium]